MQPPPPPTPNPSVIPRKAGKRQSKWGKTSSQPSVLPVAEAEPVVAEIQ